MLSEPGGSLLQRWLTSLSLSQKLLGGLLAISLVVTSIATVSAYEVFRSRAEAERLADLSHYVKERTRSEQAIFDQLRAKQAAATPALMERLDHADGPALEAQFDRLFPLQADGTRRSAPEIRDGTQAPGGDRLYGMTGFVKDGRSLSPEMKRILMAAAYVVRASGEAERKRFDNFYFTTPNNQIVMFAPDHPEKLDFYAKTAPASLDMRGMDLVKASLPQNNPTGIMSCTKLTPLLTDPKHKAMVSACVTPVYVGGRQVGAWAVTVPMGSYFMQTIKDVLPDATNLIITNQGQLIAYPGFSSEAAVTAPVIADYEKRFQLTTLAKRIRETGREFGAIESPDGTRLIAFGQVDERWYFLMSVSRAAVVQGARMAALPILLVGLLAALGQIALTLSWARSLVVRPLERLVAEAREEAPAEGPDLAQRGDEIGALARALAEERHQSQALTLGLEARVAERTAELDRANQAKSAFLATMSHELRTPLNGVIALSDLLAKRQTTDEDREMASLIIASGRLLEQVLTDILDFSKIEAGQMSLNAETFDLTACVRRVAELHRASAEAKGLTLSWTVDTAAAGGVRGDEVRLSQILSNLLSNAVKFTEIGEVCLAVSRDASGVVITVRDTGIGFSEAEGERLFKRFSQADASVTRRFGGTGLGLAICASLAELMGGAVSATSTPGEGSTFRVSLPLAAADLVVADEAAGIDASAMALPGCRVLLAEDHPANQRVVALVLEPFGVELTIVGDGALAIEAEAAGEFDAILMDLHMPNVDGLTAIRAIRKAEAARGARRTPIIALTADAMAEHVAATRAAGADAHMSKPIRPDGLVRGLAEVIAAAAAGEEPASADAAAG
jgi:signal transduction histidine kinase/CheY-like chemotaxis protein